MLSADISVNGTNTVFTVAPAGRYRISYSVSITASLVTGARLLINGVGNLASTAAPLASLSHFSNEIVVDLPANSTVSLQLYGITSSAILLPDGAGASLTIIRLS